MLAVSDADLEGLVSAAVNQTAVTVMESDGESTGGLGSNSVYIEREFLLRLGESERDSDGRRGGGVRLVYGE